MYCKAAASAGFPRAVLPSSPTGIAVQVQVVLASGGVGEQIGGGFGNAVTLGQGLVGVAASGRFASQAGFWTWRVRVGETPSPVITINVR